ncbi:MAG: RagB/SusD family nutrient uptake outer membrane protein [Bacteroidaceae bacterium]|nr:RagB/SusD family nutrient uptake outer membrane protein [Bacteroidaceae bacterium]
MKKIHNILFSLITGLSALSLVSCSDFLEEYSQDTDYVRTWKDLDELLIGDCYLPVESSSYLSYTSTPGSWIHLLGDEVQESQTGYTNQYAQGDYREKSFGYFTWQERVGQNESYTDYYEENPTWTKIYYCINVANNILSSVEDVPCVTEVEKQGVHKVKGEAHFLRAYYYFWLANLYGKPYNAATAETDLCVPLKTSDVVEDKKFTRQTVAEVYRQVLADLTIAESELKQLKTPKVSIYRADSTACHLLQSRVYLYMQQWDKASLYAKKVLAAHPALTDLNTASGKFLVKDNVENIFSMGGNDVHRIFNYICQSYSVSRELYDAYTSSDLRKSQWYWKKGLFVGPVRVALNNLYYSYDASSGDYYERAYSEKGKQEEVSGQFLMRSAEAYLNEAEAEAYMGNEDEARRMLNLLRGNRFSSSANSTVTASGAELITAIRNERRRELALEGHRWFDLRRYMVCSVQPESQPITHEWTYYSDHTSVTVTERHRFVLEANDDAYTLPIPQEVLNFNTGMPNNVRPWREYTVVQ